MDVLIDWWRKVSDLTPFPCYAALVLNCSRFHLLVWPLTWPLVYACPGRDVNVNKRTTGACWKFFVSMCNRVELSRLKFMMWSSTTVRTSCFWLKPGCMNRATRRTLWQWPLQATNFARFLGQECREEVVLALSFGRDCHRASHASGYLTHPLRPWNSNCLSSRCPPPVYAFTVRPPVSVTRLLTLRFCKNSRNYWLALLTRATFLS